VNIEGIDVMRAMSIISDPENASGKAEEIVAKLG
jgi:hypothetical protein